MADRRKSRVLLAALLCGLLAACGGADSDSTATGSAQEGNAGESGAATAEEATAELASVNVAYGGEPQIADLPAMLAIEALAAEGIVEEITTLAESELAVQAVLGGDAQLATSSPPSALAAHEQAPEIQGLYDWKRQSWALVAAPEIAEIEDLNGKTIAVHNETGFTAAAADLVIEEFGLDVTKVIIPGSEVRAQALASGQIDATIIDLSDVIALQAQLGEDAFHQLLSLGERFPEFTTGRWIASEGWLEDNPETGLRVLEAMLQTSSRVVDEPDWAVEQALRLFEEQDPVIVERTVRAFLEDDLWPVDGGLSEDKALAEIEFYNEGGQTTLEPTAETVEGAYAMSFLEEARSSAP